MNTMKLKVTVQYEVSRQSDTVSETWPVPLPLLQCTVSVAAVVKNCGPTKNVSAGCTPGSEILKSDKKVTRSLGAGFC